MKKIQNYINGELVAPISKAYLDNINPSRGKVYSLLPDSDSRDVEDAVRAAESAFPNWSNKTINERADIMNKIADLVERDLPALAEAEAIDNGKPVSLATKIDIPRAAANMRFYASAIQQFSSESHQPDNRFLNYTTRKPVGIAGCISPWNLPLYLFTWKIAPALASGNTVVAKPSEITPMTAYLFSKLCIEGGLPKGVLNIIHGLGSKVGQAITEHPDIPLISFTGGTETGKQIAKTAAPMFKKLSLELGGKNPNIIFGDCNLEEALFTSLKSSFSNQGQICLCGSRIYVEDTIYDVFIEEFKDRIKELKVGDPLDSNTEFGSLVSKEHLTKVMSYIDLAKQEGGEILVGGHEVKLEGECSAGYFMEPTVIVGLDENCRTNQEEIFGPVVSIMPFKTEEQVIELANSTDYGLAAMIWTRDLNKAHRVAHKVNSGIIWINCWLVRDLRTPFGGMKQSGVGREGGLEALRFFTEPKNVCIDIN